MSEQEPEWHHGQLLPVPASCQNETKSVDEVLLDNERLKAENQRLREALQGMIGILTPKQREKQFPNLYKKAIGALQQEGGSQ